MDLEQALTLMERCCCNSLLPNADTAEASAVVDKEIESLRTQLAAAEARCNRLEEEATRKISERDARIKRLEQGLFDLGRHEGHLAINNGTSTIGMFVKLPLNRSE
jgi:hypothetical protein